MDAPRIPVQARKHDALLLFFSLLLSSLELSDTKFCEPLIRALLQASDDMQSWTPLEFQFKPGNVTRAPRMTGLPGLPDSVPGMHQPRLDWQVNMAHVGQSRPDSGVGFHSRFIVLSSVFSLDSSTHFSLFLFRTEAVLDPGHVSAPPRLTGCLVHRSIMPCLLELRQTRHWS